MLCPVDDSELHAASLGGYQIHRCMQCLGVSVAGNLLRAVRAHASLELHRSACDAPNMRACPTDAKAMKSLDYKGVAMYVCPQCLGLWLSAGQLSRLLELVGPPPQSDLSRIGQSLTTIPSGNGVRNLEDMRGILEIAADIIEVMGKIGD